MFSEKKIQEYTKPVKEAISELFKYVENNVKLTNDYILFLENGHKTEYHPKGWSPYVIGPGEEYHDDKDRVDFYLQYLQSGSKEWHNSLKDEGKIENLDRYKKFSFYLELMIYTHIWENKKNLRELKQIAHLIDGNEYDWGLEIDDYGKNNLIRTEIRDVFLDHDLDAGKIIDEVYHNQIRNAFAHSQISFMPGGEKIRLGNYDGKYHDLKNISEEEWEDRFLKTTIFFHQFLVKKEKERVRMGKANKTAKIWYPNKSGTSKHQAEIYWDESGQAYSWNKPAS